jgi:hypothetical protein
MCIVGKQEVTVYKVYVYKQLELWLYVKGS